MKINIKRLAHGSLIFVLVILIINVSQMSLAKEDLSINIIVKGKHLRMDGGPILRENKTYIPIRDFAEALGFRVNWMKKERTAKLSNLQTTILIPIGEEEISVNDKKIRLDEKSFIEKGRTYIPLRSVSEVISEKVQWDQKKKIAIVGKFTAKEYLEDTFVYTNEEHGYTMNFPNSWKEEAVLETKNGNLYVYDRASYKKFKEKGFNNFGPAFGIRVEESPVFVTVPYDDVLLTYKDGKYIETSFGRDFQYFPETVESYKKIYKEAKESLGSFKTLGENNPPTEMGKTETFIYDGLKLKVTNVGDVRVESMIDDGGNPWEYNVFTCYPGASVTVLDAGMNDGRFTEDRKPYSNWGIELSSHKPIRIVENMNSFDVTSDTIGIYNLEASLYVLNFEMAK